MFRTLVFIASFAVAIAVQAEDPLLDHDDTLATATLPEAFRPDETLCCDTVAETPVEPGAGLVADESHVDEAPLLETSPGDGGLIGFARECAELEMVPLKSLHESDDKRMMVAVDFEGVLGLYVLTD